MGGGATGGGSAVMASCEIFGGCGAPISSAMTTQADCQSQCDATPNANRWCNWGGTWGNIRTGSTCGCAALQNGVPETCNCTGVTTTVTGPVVTSTYPQLSQSTLSGTQADAPGNLYPGGAHFLATHWNWQGSGLEQVLMQGSLDQPYTSIASAKQTCATSGGYCVNAPMGTSPAFTRLNTTDTSQLWFVDTYWPSPGVTPEVLGFIHEEAINYTRVTGIAMGIGLAWSSDGGNTWTYLGRILTAFGDPMPCNAGYTFNIEGAPYVINNGDFLVYYVDFDDSCGVNIAVAHAKVSDVVAAARAGNLGSGLWTKYYNGWGSEPGLGGHSSFPTPMSAMWGITHTQALHDATSKSYFMPLTFMSWTNGSGGNIDTSVTLYTSADGLTWANSTVIADEPASDQMPAAHLGNSTYAGGYQYCSLTDVDGTANHELGSGRQFYVYCFKYYDTSAAGAPSYTLQRWTVSVSGCAP
jgi:hypothetical protein